jgi:hypothetical protein
MPLNQMQYLVKLKKKHMTLLIKMVNGILVK